MFVSPVDMALCSVDRVLVDWSTEPSAQSTEYKGTAVWNFVFQFRVSFGILFFHYCLAARFCDLYGYMKY